MSTVSAVLFATLLASPAPSTTPQPTGKAFENPRAAADALIQAAAANDIAALSEIFGPEGGKIVVSADEVKDKNDRERFVELAREKTDVAVDPKNPHRATLKVGADAWPFPVALVEKNRKWQFATKEGLREVLLRRIGQDEIDAMEVCRGYVDAQLEYASEVRDDSGVHHYATRILSTPGKRDGLAWMDADGKPAGPIAEAVARAIEEGYSKRTDPYHGYFFKILTSQGPSAPKGRLDYVIQGQMIGGFALVAWPADYRATGVKTFLISHDDVLYEKDLGPDTAKIAGEMTAYDPDKTWRAVPNDEEEEPPAPESAPEAAPAAQGKPGSR